MSGGRRCYRSSSYWSHVHFRHCYTVHPGDGRGRSTEELIGALSERIEAAIDTPGNVSVCVCVCVRVYVCVACTVHIVCISSVYLVCISVYLVCIYGRALTSIGANKSRITILLATTRVSAKLNSLYSLSEVKNHWNRSLHGRGDQVTRKSGSSGGCLQWV